MNALVRGKRAMKYSDFTQHGMRLLPKEDALSLLVMAYARAEGIEK